jgi:hypothetical protein
MLHASAHTSMSERGQVRASSRMPYSCEHGIGIAKHPQGYSALPKGRPLRQRLNWSGSATYRRSHRLKRETARSPTLAQAEPRRHSGP